MWPEVNAVEPRTLLLSNLKGEIRERFNLYLSETRLGETKLAELLSRHPFSTSVCKISWRKNNPILLPHEHLRENGPSTHPLLESSPGWLERRDKYIRVTDSKGYTGWVSNGPYMGSPVWCGYSAVPTIRVEGGPSLPPPSSIMH